MYANFAEWIRKNKVHKCSLFTFKVIKYAKLVENCNSTLLKELWGGELKPIFAFKEGGGIFFIYIYINKECEKFINFACSSLTKLLKGSG